MAPSGSMFRVASNNTSAHFQLDVKFVHHVSTVSRSHLPYLSCFLQRFDFGSVNFLHAIPVSCSVMPCSVIFCYVSFAGPTPSATWKLCPCLYLHLSVCMCLSASMQTMRSKSTDLARVAPQRPLSRICCNTPPPHCKSFIAFAPPELATHTQKCIVANCHSTHLEKLHRYPGIDTRPRRIQCNPNMHARRLATPSTSRRCTTCR